MTTNDGYGNANLTFNHTSGVPDTTGSSNRIETSVDNSTGFFSFEIGNSTTSGTAVSLDQVMYMSTSYVDSKKAFRVGGNPVINTSGEWVGTSDINLGDGSTDSRILIKKADNNVSDHIQFYNGTTRIGEIGCEDSTWLRINQETAKNIYTPRYIRADGGFFIDGTSKGLDGSGNLIGGMSVTAGAITGTTCTLSSTLTLNSTAEAPSEWNAVLLSDSGVVKIDSSVQIHGSGYLRASYLNMSHSTTTRSGETVFYTSTDSYIRRNNATGVVASIPAAASASNISTAKHFGLTNYVYNSTGGTATRGDFSHHVYHCWSNNCAVNVTSSTWQRGDIIEFRNVKGTVNITVTGTRIYMPNGSHDTVVTWNQTVGGFKLLKYSTSTGYWMVAMDG